jgi:hypothetical protein
MDASRVARGFRSFLASRINCGLISGLFVQSGLDPLLALMVIREVGAHLGGGFGISLTQEAQQLYRPTV